MGACERCSPLVTKEGEGYHIVRLGANPLVHEVQGPCTLGECHGMGRVTHTHTDRQACTATTHPQHTTALKNDTTALANTLTSSYRGLLHRRRGLPLVGTRCVRGQGTWAAGDGGHSSRRWQRSVWLGWRCVGPRVLVSGVK